MHMTTFQVDDALVFFVIPKCEYSIKKSNAKMEKNLYFIKFIFYILDRTLCV